MLPRWPTYRGAARAKSQDLPFLLTARILIARAAGRMVASCRSALTEVGKPTPNTVSTSREIRNLANVAVIPILPSLTDARDTHHCLPESGMIAAIENEHGRALG